MPHALLVSLLKQNDDFGLKLLLRIIEKLYVSKCWGKRKISYKKKSVYAAYTAFGKLLKHG